jgi:hypothetical protein
VLDRKNETCIYFRKGVLTIPRPPKITHKFTGDPLSAGQCVVLHSYRSLSDCTEGPFRAVRDLGLLAAAPEKTATSDKVGAFPRSSVALGVQCRRVRTWKEAVVV